MEKRSILITALFIVIFGCSSKKVSTNDNSAQDYNKPSNTIIAQDLPQKNNDEKDSQIPKKSPTNENDLKNSDVIFFDDFSNPESGWSMWSNEKTSGEYKKGEYVFKYYRYNTWSWALAPGKHLSNLSNYKVQYKAENPTKTPFIKFGIYCHYKNDKNLYYVAVTSSGYYNITKYTDGMQINLTENGWVYSDKIPKQAKSYDFSVECSNGDISLFINGNQLIKVHDETYSNGALKLYGAYTGHETGEIRFDNFDVKRISPSNISAINE